MNKVTIIGSINYDTTLRMNYLPKMGETIHSTELFTAGGGKGANQAIAAKRNGAETSFIGAVGKDLAGKQMLELLTKENIDTGGITTLENEVTGSAYILLDSLGENSIIIHSGANNALTQAQVKKYEDKIIKSDFLIAQFESTISSTIEAFSIAQAKQVKTILNPAPAFEQIPEELLKVTDMIVPNETEAEILTGIKIKTKEDMLQASKMLRSRGIQVVVITLGKKGAFYDDGIKQDIVPAIQVNAIDTTAAGDTFIGAMVAILKKDFSNLEEAIRYGTRAAAVTVQRFGAQPSIPYQYEL